MNKLRFGDLPLMLRVVVGIALLTAWVVFEETVVDRTGLWRYMPDYHVGVFCVWDAGMMLAITVGLILASRTQNA
jgi:hypothetical protein